MKIPHPPPLTAERVSELKQRMKSGQLSELDRKTLIEQVNFIQQLRKIVEMTESPASLE